MALDSTFWVAVSFFLFFGGLIYLKVPQKINEILNKLILDIKNEIDESEKLRTEAKILLDNAQKKLNTAQSVSDEILNQAKKEGGASSDSHYKKNTSTSTSYTATTHCSLTSFGTLLLLERTRGAGGNNLRHHSLRVLFRKTLL